MSVPNWEAFMVPVLHALADREEARLSDIRERVAETNMLGMAPADMLIMTRKRRRTQFEDRVYWAAYGMSRAGLVNRPRYGVYQISEEGKRVLETNPEALTDRDLEKYAGYMEWKGKEAETVPIPAFDPAVFRYDVCAACRHYEVLNGERTMIDGVETTIDDEFGECRAEPPTVSIHDTPGGIRRRATWPVVRHDDWCGKWEDFPDDEQEEPRPYPPSQPPLLQPRL